MMELPDVLITLTAGERRGDFSRPVALPMWSRRARTKNKAATITGDGSVWALRTSVPGGASCSLSVELVPLDDFARDAVADSDDICRLDRLIDQPHANYPMPVKGANGFGVVKFLERGQFEFVFLCGNWISMYAFANRDPFQHQPGTVPAVARTRTQTRGLHPAGPATHEGTASNDAAD